jgi:hypothetical protein
MTPGTPQHRDLFCRNFVDSHVAFEPEALPWPELEPRLLGLLRTFPFWSYARSIEHRAGRMVTAFARTLEDPVIREAVAVQGVEETRHGRLMAHVVERYGIDAPLLPLTDPPAVKDDFLTFGFGECADSVIGFGAFAISRQKQLFPESLLSIFENVLWEEARHIVFFINWWRYELARDGRDGLLSRTLDALRYHARAIAGTADDAANAPSLDLPTVQRLMDGVTPAEFLAAALAENRRLMARFDRRLVRPRLVPVAATLALLTLRLLPPRAPQEPQQSLPRLVA